MALENQSIILKKTELALDSKTELINAKNEIIENLKIVVDQFLINAPRPNEHTLTSEVDTINEQTDEEV